MDTGLWECKKCNRKMEKPLICWGESNGKKVDIIDYFCPYCPSSDLIFNGSKQELDTFWNLMWDEK